MNLPANRRMNTDPIAIQRTNRMHTARGLTSLPAGKMVPIAAIPLLREDSVRSGRLRFSFESMETAELLMNAINVNVKAYLVPTLAFERFEGSMDQLNRSWAGEAFKGLPAVPYIEQFAAGAHGSNPIHKYLGLHARPAQQVNTAYVEAYNAIWNFRAKNRSPDITERDRLDKTLAPAFWAHERFAHIVPDFDQAKIDGEVPLNIVEGNLPVRGLGTRGPTPAYSDSTTFRETGGTEGAASSLSTGTNSSLSVRQDPANPGYPLVFAEMAANGITVSLSNIELARKTQAFATLRQQYSGHSDEWIIDMLMDGLSIPEQAWTQPMLIGERKTVFGMGKRYATDSGNLTESVVSGATFVDMSIALPRIPTGGVVMVVAEITPDQLFERQRDPYLHAADIDAFPHALPDMLDPEKVSIVPNEYVDIDHDTPDATFGYAPLNYEWNIEAPRIGGRFFRPEVDAGFDEDRQRIWAVETQNPTLSTDFYLCTNMHTKPFVVTNQDPFECVTVGDVLINGLTQFGGHLIEASNDYEKVFARAPQERIEKSA